MLFALFATQLPEAPAPEASPTPAPEAPEPEEPPPGPCAALAEELEAPRWSTEEFPEDPSAIAAKITPACRTAFENEESPELDYLRMRARRYSDPEGELRVSVALGTLCLLHPSWAEGEMISVSSPPGAPSVIAHCLLGLAADDTRAHRDLIDAWMRDLALRSDDPRRPRVQPAAFVLLAQAPRDSYVRARGVQLLLDAERKQAPGRDALRATLCADRSLPLVDGYCARSTPVLEPNFGVMLPVGLFGAHALGALAYVLLVHVLRRWRHAHNLLGVGMVVSGGALVLGVATLSVVFGLMIFGLAFLALRFFGARLLAGGFEFGRAMDPGPGLWRTALAALFAGFYLGVAFVFLRPWE